MNAIKNSFKNISKYPSAVMGILVVVALVALAIYAMITIPYNEAIRLWRGGEEVWYQNPKFAPPAWINYFSSKKYSESFSARTTDGSIAKEVIPGAEGTSTVSISYTFDFSSDFYPQELLIYFTSKFQEKQPFISAEWQTPDGRTIRIANLGISKKQTYRFAQDDKLKTRLKTDDVIPALFSDPETG